MKTIIPAVLLSLFSVSALGNCPHLELGIPKDSDQVLCREGYALGYNYNLKSAEWVSYRLERETSPGVERIDSFRVDPDIPKRYRTEPADYDEPVYHLGHLANAESIDRTLSASSETFMMSNIVPQLPGHNVGIWKGLENRERKWADLRGVVYVFQGVLYEGRLKFIGNKVPVPTSFWKVVYDPRRKEAISYLIPHKKLYTKSLSKYRVSVDKIESRAGIDLLSYLPLDLQNKIEFNAQPKTWKRR